MASRKNRKKRSGKQTLTPETPPAPTPQPARLWISLGVALCCVVGAALFYFTKSDAPQPAPSAASASEYSAADSCAACHSEIAEAFSQTGMARSFYPPSLDSALSTPADFYHNESDRHYRVFERDGKYFQRRHQVIDGSEENIVEKEIHFVMGSGNHARSYLHRDRLGKIVQLPLGWYAENGGFWAMSPGYDQPSHKGFRREISFDCMFCHNSYPEIAEGADSPGNDPLFPGEIPHGIDCQRCHGPGGAHIRAVSAGESESVVREAILNPAALSAERQLEVCMQCHLETTSRPLPYAVRRIDRGIFSYRPDEPLADYILHFDQAEGDDRDHFEIAHAAYRLRKSKCFIESPTLTCTTCHDPHSTATPGAAACESCHKSIPLASHPTDPDCVKCHMPSRRTDDVVHVVMTDHYIQRNPPQSDLLQALTESTEPNYQGPVELYYPKRLPESPSNELHRALAQVIEGSAGPAPLAAAINTHDSDESEFHFHLAESLWKSGDEALAFEHYDSALARQPGHLVASRNFSAALIEAGQPARAEAILRAALEFAPDDPKTWNNLGEALLYQEKAGDAVGALQRAISLDPDLVEAHTNLALSYSRQSADADAQAAAREAIRLQPDSAVAHNVLANLLGPDAEPSYRTALRYDPDYPEALYNYGSWLASAGRLDEAERRLRQAVRIRPEFTDALNNLGNVVATRGELDEAIRLFRQAISHQPKQPQAHLNLGVALLNRGDMNGAVQTLSTAAKLAPSDGRTLLTLGIALAEQGDLTSAVSRLQEASKTRDPSIREAALEALGQLSTTSP